LLSQALSKLIVAVDSFSNAVNQLTSTDASVSGVGKVGTAVIERSESSPQSLPAPVSVSTLPLKLELGIGDTLAVPSALASSLDVLQDLLPTMPATTTNLSLYTFLRTIVCELKQILEGSCDESLPTLSAPLVPSSLATVKLFTDKDASVRVDSFVLRLLPHS
jgi:hypothetical protein